MEEDTKSFMDDWEILDEPANSSTIDSREEDLKKAIAQINAVCEGLVSLVSNFEPVLQSSARAGISESVCIICPRLSEVIQTVLCSAITSSHPDVTQLV